MAARKPKLEYSIICDDIREEVGHKMSFMGVYGPNIVVPEIPFIFPQLCAAINYKNVKSGDSFSIKFKDPAGKQIGKPIEGSITQEVKGSINFIMLAKFAPLKVDKEGPFKLEVIFNNDQSTKKEIAIPVKVRK